MEIFLDDSGLPAELIKKGQYGKVALVKPLEVEPFPQGNKILCFLHKLIIPKPKRQKFYPVNMANYILYGRKVWEQDIEQIPKGKNYRERLNLADILVCTDIFLQSTRTNYYRFHYTGSAGLYLADFLEVIPSPTAARIIHAAADPSIAKDLLNNEGQLNNVESNSQSLAIEGVVLLPPETRKNIFQEMTKIQPSDTWKFINLISASWNNPASGLDGPSLIRANFDNSLPFNTYPNTKIAEVMSELPLLRKIAESAK